MSNTVILGSGIIGLSTAYYLSESGNTSPETIHLVDPINELFHCASGFAGGFLAKDWFAPSVAPLGALSFKLHKDLASKHNGRKTWGYSSSLGMSYSADTESAIGGSGEDWLASGTSRAQASNASKREGNGGPVWLKKSDGGSMEVISQEGSTAQIDPLKLCRFLLDECLKRGVKLHQPARATSITKDENNRMKGVRISKDGEETELSCTRLILASGVWTPSLFSTLFPSSKARIPIAPLAGHSLLVKNPHFKENTEEEVCHAVFAADNLGFSPEYFSRAGGEVYLAGLNTTMIPLPSTPNEVKTDPDAVRKLKDCVAEMMGGVDGKDVEVLRESLCFRPVTSSGRPVVSRVTDERLGAGFKTKEGMEGGVFVAAGHGAWGIAESLGTGLCLTELVEGRKTSADIEALALP